MTDAASALLSARLQKACMQLKMVRIPAILLPNVLVPGPTGLLLPSATQRLSVPKLSCLQMMMGGALMILHALAS